MKKHLLILSFIGLSGAVNAQTVKIFNNSKVPASIQQKWIAQFNKQSKANTAFKTTTAKERLAAESGYSDFGSGFTVSDSTKYMYDKDRGSTFDLQYMEYANYGRNEGVKCDSSATYSEQGSGLVISDATKATYNTNNTNSSFVSRNGNPLVNNSRTDYTYDGAGNIIKEVEFSWNQSTNEWDSTRRTTHTFNTQNKITQSVSYDIMSAQDEFKIAYTYNGSGDMTGTTFSIFFVAVWQPIYKITMTYDGNHHVLTNKGEQYDMSGWVNSNFDTSGYNGTDFFTYHVTKIWDTATLSWMNSEKETRTLNSQNLPAIQTTSYWDSATAAWIPDQDIRWTYNTNNNPTKAEYYSYVGSTPSSTPDDKRNYYYEYYFDQGVNTVNKNTTINVYPNPATETVNIRWNSSLKNNMANIQLVNTLGQAVYNNTLQISGNETTVSLNGLPTGNYLLSVKDADGILLQTQTLVKQ